MKKFFVLLKVSLRSMVAASAFRGRRRTVSGLGVLALMAFLALYMSGVYSSALLGVLAPMGMEDMVFIYMGIAALVGGLMYTAFAVKGVLFGGKDNDLLLALPVSSAALVAGRVSAIYVESLVFSFFMLVPAGVGCAIMTQGSTGRTLLFWVRVLLAAVLLPLLDTALSVLVGAVMAFLSSKVSRKALGQNLVMAVFLALVFWFSFGLNGMLARLAADVTGVREKLGWAAPMIWMADGLMGDWGKLLAFALCCILPFVAVVMVLGAVYRRAVTAFSGYAARSDYKLSRQSAAGQRKALLKKEAKRFFGSPTYFWNSGLGLIMLLAAGVASIWKRELLQELTAVIPPMPAAAVVMGFCLSTCAIAAPSVSLEGKNFWILREAPLDEGRLIRIKTEFQLLLTLPCTLVASVLLAIGLGLSLWQWAVLLAAAVLFAVGHACFGMLMGLTFPRLDAPNEAVVIKQSLLSLLSMFVPMVALAAAGIACWLGSLMGAAAGVIFPLAVLAALAAVCALLLRKRGAVLFRTL